MIETTKSTEQITKLSFSAMAGVLLSRASGLVRTIVVNATFGAATAMDAFNAAFRIPNSLRDLFADGALSSAFMTALVIEQQKGIEQERRLIAIVLGFFSVVTLCLALLGVFFSEQIMSLMSDARFKLSGGLPLAINLFRLLIFYLPLTMINAVIMAILGVHGQSFRAMNGSLFLSVGMIIGALAGPFCQSCGMMAVLGLAMGALLGASLQMLYQMYPLFGMKLIPIPNFNLKTWWGYPPLRNILVQMMPRAIGQGALVIALGINTYFAIQIGQGVLTYVVTAVTIIQVPIGLFGVTMGFVALPALTATLPNKDSKHFSALLIEGLKTSFWLASITTLYFALLIVPFYVLLFQHGKITYADTLNNCIAVCMYSTGVILASGNKVLVNTLYVLNATRQIVYNAIIYICINTLLNIILVPRLGLIGLGFSFGIATSLDFWLNYFFIKYYFRVRGYQGSPYVQGGDYFTQKILCVNLAGFSICLLGVWLIKNFWTYFAVFFHRPLNFSLAFMILLLVGGVLTALIFCIVMKYAPAHLKNSLLGKIPRQFRR